MGSKSLSLNGAEVKNLAVTALLVGASAAVTYVSQNLSGIDFGTASAFIVPIVSTVLAAVLTWLKDNTKK